MTLGNVFLERKKPKEGGGLWKVPQLMEICERIGGLRRHLLDADFTQAACKTPAGVSHTYHKPDGG
jgi:hypothetical protein